MRDVYLWTAYVLGCGIFAVTVRIVVGRLLDGRRERRYVPPAKLYTEVRPLAAGGIVPSGQWYVLGDDTPPLVVPNLRTGRSDRSPVRVTLDNTDGLAKPWALDALSEVRKAAAEDGYATLAEFASPVPSSPALIWAEMVGVRHVQGLVVA